MNFLRSNVASNSGSTEAAAGGSGCPSWTSLYSHEGKIALAARNLLTVLPIRPKEWRLKFKLQPTNFDYNVKCVGGTKCDILYMTNNCDVDMAWGCYGSQIPRVLFEKGQNMRLSIITASDGNGNHYGGSWKMPTPAIGAWTSIEMSEELTADGKYEIKQIIDGVLVHSWFNSQPQSFENVSVYAYKSGTSQSGFIRELLIQGKGKSFN